MNTKKKLLTLCIALSALSLQARDYRYRVYAGGVSEEHWQFKNEALALFPVKSPIHLFYAQLEGDLSDISTEHTGFGPKFIVYLDKYLSSFGAAAQRLIIYDAIAKISDATYEEAFLALACEKCAHEISEHDSIELITKRRLSKEEIIALTHKHLQDKVCKYHAQKAA